jgi:hypothetical protein
MSFFTTSNTQKAEKYVNSKYFIKPVYAIFLSLFFSGFSSAEGIYQFGTDLNQPLSTTTSIFIHVPNDGDIIRTHLCRVLEGGTAQPGESVKADIFSVQMVNGILEKDILIQALSSTVANIDCAHDFTTTLPKTPATGELMEYTVPTAGIYAIELDTPGTHYGRWDFSIVPGGTPDADVDPTIDSGNVFSYHWRINRLSNMGDIISSTDANLYALVDGGFANTEYVWEIDLNEFAGSEYELTANSIGLAEPNSGTSATFVDGSVTGQYPVYVSYPTGANPSAAPVASPTLTDIFTFVDDGAGLDNAISPDGDLNEDTGDFSFTSDVNGTYALTIDLNNDGLFNSGDRVLIGEVDADVLNTINWDGTDASGATVDNGEYDVQLSLRVGEMHVVVSDAETSGGGTNDDGSIFEGGTGDNDGLTILQATDASTVVGTQVFWDDTTNLTGGSNILGALSSTALFGDHRHTWGDFTAAGATLGADTFIDTYTYGASTTSIISVIVAVDNTAPTVADSTIDVDENSDNGVSVGTITGVDVDGDFLAYSITAGNDLNLFVIDSRTGEITVNGALNNEDVDQYSLTVEVFDQVNTDSATITVDINDINEAPTISGTPATSVAEDSFYTFTPTGNDVDGDILTYSVVNLPSWTTFDTNSGNISGTPDNGDVGSHADIQITVSSNGSLTDTLAAFSIEVTNTADAPLATDDTASTDEDILVTIDVLANDNDTDVGDTLTITAVTNIVNGAAVINGNQVDFTPAADFNGSGSFSYTVSDGVLTDTGDVAVTVNAVNDAPVISGTPTTTISEDNFYTFTPTGSDVDGDILTYSVVNLPSWTTFDTNSGNISGTPDNGDVGSHADIQITVTSNGSLTDTLAAFSIEVTNTPQAPVATDDTASTDEDILVTIDVLANDNDADVGDTLTITAVNSIVNGTAVINGNQVDFTPAADFNGSGSFSYTVSDGVLTDTGDVAVTVNAVNDAPVISGTPTTTISEDSFYTFTPTGSDVDGDTLTYSVVNPPSWATFNTLDGNLAGTPDNDDVGSHTNIQITVTSNGSLTDTLAAFAIEVTNSNDAPVASDDTATTDEDTDVTIDVLVNDFDVDVSDTLTITLVSNSVNGTAVSDGLQVVFTPTADFNGIGTFTYTVNDGTADDTATVTVTINSVNDAPIISGTPPTSATQDLSYSFTPTATDVDGDALTFSISNSPNWASFNTTDGTLSGTPDNEDVGDYANITITVTSNGSLTDSLAAYTISVGNTNDAPIAVDDAATTDEDTDVTIDVLANDTDVDAGDILSVNSVSSVVNGTAVVLANQIVFTPDPNFNGTGTLTYTVSDGSFSDTANVTITVNSVNDAPVISGTPSTSVVQDVAYLFTPSAIDDDDDTITYSIVGQPSWATFDTATGALSGTPSNDDVGDYAGIVITASSQGPLTDDLPSFSISVTDLNDAPIASDDAVSTDEDNEVIIDVLANDTDVDAGDTLIIASISSVVNGTTVIINNQVTFTPTENVNGIGSFIYTMNDGAISDTASVTVTINSINDIPVINGTPATIIDQDDTYSFTPTASDDDNETLTFSITNQPSWTSFDVNSGALTGTTSNADIGAYADIIISVSDAAATVSLTAFTLTVNNLNDNPVAVDDSVSTDEDVAIVIDVLGNDSDDDVDDTLTITQVNTVLNGVAAIENGLVRFTPDANYNGAASFSYNISDTVATATAIVTIDVISVNDAPTIDGTPATSVLQDVAYSFVPTANDDDGDLLTFAITNMPSWAGFNTSTGALTGTPTNADVGDNANIEISVSSTDGLSDSLPIFTLSVTNTNDAPVANNDTATTDEDIAITIDVLSNDTDIDTSDTLVITETNTPVGGVAIITSNQVLFTPDAEFNGTASFNYVVSDGSVTDSASVTVTVNNINDAPIISGTPSNSVEQDSVYSFTPTASDADGDALTFSISNRPSWASFDTLTGQLNGTPLNVDVANYPNIVITVTSNGSLASSLDTFNINVIDVNDAPIALDDAATIDEDTNITIDVLANDTDIDPQDNLTITAIGLVTNGTAVIVGTQVLYTPDTNFNGVGIFDYTISDGDISDIATVSITVNSIDDAPTISGTPPINVEQDSAYGFTPDAADLDNEPLVFSITDLPVWGSFNTSTGRLSGTPSNADVGFYPNIKITVTAGAQSATLAAFSITVNNVNDAPVANDDNISLNEDDDVTINVLANDTDADVDDVVTLLSINSVTNGVAVIDNGRIIFTPTPDFNGTATILYTVTDSVLTDTATVTITVDSLNDAPEISGIPTTSILENDVYSFTPSASDADNDILTFSISNLPSWATFSTATGALTGTPDNNESGSYGNIEISVSSQGGLSDSLPAFTIVVDNVNIAPVLVDDTSTTDEDIAISIDVLANDSDIDIADTLIVTAISAVVNGTAVIVNNQVVYTPNTNFNGAGSFTYSVTDGGVTDSANVVVTINSVNDVPVISGTPVTSVLQDIAYTFTPTASDNDAGDTLTFSINNMPSWAAFSNTTGALTGTPGNDDVGSYPNIQITVNSDGGLSASLTLFAITVTNVNDAPVAVADSVTVDEDSQVTISILANDSDLDDDPLTVDSISALNGSVVLNNDQSVLYTPNANYNGSDTISYTISDGNGSSDSAIVDVTITSINDVPVAVDDAATITEGESLSFAVLDNDSDDDNDTLTISTADAANGSVVINIDNSLTYTPDVTFVGVENIVYTIQDGNGGTGAATLIVAVNPITIVISGTPETSLLEGEDYSFTPNVEVSDNVTYTFTVTNLPSWTTFDTLTGSLSGTPERDDIATFSAIEICVDDTFATDCLASFEITVLGDLDRDSIGDDVDEDIDGDGMSNDFEIANGFDPEDDSDATEDADGDGISNLNEFLAGTNPNSDDNPPTLLQPVDITTDAISLLNEVTIGNASATDFVAGVSVDCCDIVNDAPARFSPGTTEVTWTATDEAGNVTTEVQLIKVNPIVSFTGDVVAAEGEQASVTLLLNGDAPDYPYEITYAITGGSATEGVDYTWNDGIATFTEGTSLNITFDIADDDDAEGVETILVEIDVTENRGSQFALEVSISEDNVAPFIDLSLQQNGVTVTQIQADLGNVTVSAQVTDSNSTDTHTYDWSASDNRLTNSSSLEENFVFDPSNLSLDVYRLALTVTDNGTPTESAFALYDLKSTTTALDEETGLPCNIATHNANVVDQYLAEAQMGICIRMSQFSKLSEGGGVLLSVNDFTNQSALSNDEHTTIGGRYNFNLQSSFAFAGYQGTVVIPLREAIPSDNLFRILDAGMWRDFDTSGADAILSASGELGYCPPPFDSSYVTGLVAGNTCIQISMTDGGTNDSDANINGVIEFAGGVHERVITPPVISGTPETSLLEGEVYSFTPTVQVFNNLTYSLSITNLPSWASFDTLTGNLSGTPERDDVATFAAIEICVDDTLATDCLATFEISVTGDLDRDGIGDDMDEDIDGDGMPNDFEIANGLDPEDASDASEDPDGDGISNLNEFLGGTDPNSNDNPPPPPASSGGGGSLPMSLLFLFGLVGVIRVYHRN